MTNRTLVIQLLDCACIFQVKKCWASGLRRTHALHRCGPFRHVSHVAWSQCWPHGWAVQKRLNRLRCRLFCNSTFYGCGPIECGITKWFRSPREGVIWFDPRHTPSPTKLPLPINTAFSMGIGKFACDQIRRAKLAAVTNVGVPRQCGPLPN